jgi:hypothetical protein
MSWLSELFGGGKDPSKEANKYLNQIPGAVNPYYQPYINQGQQANQMLQGQYGQLLNDPNALFAKFGQGYQQSPGYQFKLNQALQSGTNAAAAGGMAGSPLHQQNAMQTANDIASQDYNDYINHIMNLYGLGLQGEQGFSNQGYNASTGYGNILGSNLAQQGGLAYQGTAGQNANKANLFNNLLSLGGTLGGAYLEMPGAGGPNLLPNRSYG